LRELAKREDDEREFADEVDYPTTINVRDRFRKYTGMKSFRSTEWNPYVIFFPGIPLICFSIIFLLSTTKS
jgi:hypothetical protein